MPDLTANAPVLWRPLHGQVGQRVPSDLHYWWDNHLRPPGQCVVQVTIEGSILYRDQAGEHRVAAGRGVIFAHGDASSYGTPPVPHAPYVADWICIEGAGLSTHLMELSRRFGPVFDADPALIAGIHRLVGLCAQQTLVDPTVLAAAVHGFVLQLWRHLEAHHRASRPPVELAVEAILADPYLPWSLKEWADHFQVSREHLCRTFTARVGEPPSRWIATRKTERARHLAAETGLPARDILALAGITSRFALRRLLKRPG